MGPPWSKRENGFVISENVDGGMRLYYEPHCDYDDGSVSSVGLVDAIITPASTQLIGGVFPLVIHAPCGNSHHSLPPSMLIFCSLCYSVIVCHAYHLTCSATQGIATVCWVCQQQHCAAGCSDYRLRKTAYGTSVSSLVYAATPLSLPLTFS